ncbi:hypothetical protein Cs7R123_36080 [Catellatospora sp. TT07R-123]|uniref:hypothetical protein n=1 Tax=Catellatospora sp. TT07R-123 TaxID=2733863 RepID=UPI001B231A6F|nr:hypothetical protein [Catellatospora sp. TT07R-123]GHJ46266.1 hypothetical protein Cs7R123_36080 [Catellatospora sp. TT07R-123]
MTETVRPRGADEQGQSAGERRTSARSRRVGGAVALVAAVGAAAVMLTLDPGGPGGPARPENGTPELAAGAALSQLPGLLPDGAPYTPVYLLDPQRSVGTAPTADENGIRLLLLSGGQQRELVTVPRERAPEFAGFTTDGTTLAWLELTSDKDGAAHTRVMAAPLAAGAPRVVTPDTGNVVLFDKQGDLSLHDGLLSWISDIGKPDVSAVFTVPLAGGKPQRREVPGAWSISAWPWLVSEDTADGTPVRLHDLGSGAETAVPAQPGEMLSCSPAWCRAVTIGGDDAATTTIELRKPDGSGTVRTAVGSVAAAVTDIALLDRYEVYSRSSADYAATELLLYDLKTAKLTRVAPVSNQVVARDGMLWWSTGDNETLVWHVLDLRALAL